MQVCGLESKIAATTHAAVRMLAVNVQVPAPVCGLPDVDVTPTFKFGRAIMNAVSKQPATACFEWTPARLAVDCKLDSVHGL